MRAGRLDRRVTLESSTAPTSGDPTAETWDEECTVWAEQMDLAGAERFLRSGLTSETSAVYRIRYLSGVDSSWRLCDGAGVWRIIDASEGMGRNRELLLQCARFSPDHTEGI